MCRSWSMVIDEIITKSKEQLAIDCTSLYIQQIFNQKWNNWSLYPRASIPIFQNAVGVANFGLVNFNPNPLLKSKNDVHRIASSFQIQHQYCLHVVWNILRTVVATPFWYARQEFYMRMVVGDVISHNIKKLESSLGPQSGIHSLVPNSHHTYTTLKDKFSVHTPKLSFTVVEIRPFLIFMNIG